MKVYIVLMTRWGDPEGHTYVHAVCTEEVLAEAQGLIHEADIAGKYEYSIIPMEILSHPQNMGQPDPELVQNCITEARLVVGFRNSIRNAVKGFPSTYEPPLLPRQGKEEIVESTPTVARLKRVKKEIKTGKSKHYRKIGRAGWNSRKVAKQTKKERV